MDTRHINYILEIAQTKNFSRAAENLFISQAALTYHIKAIESEIGFSLFDRSPKGAVLTHAGERFCVTLKNIRDEFKTAVEQGQNFSRHSRTDVIIGLPMRSAIYFLPKAIEIFESNNEGISVMPHFLPLYDTASFLKGEEDILFARYNSVRHIPGIKIHKLFDSRIYLITEKTDDLAGRDIIRPEDLAGRVLMVGGGSPPELQAVQRRLIDTLNIRHFNSNDRETTLTNISAHKGVCLAPGFLNDHDDVFAWTLFDCPERVKCVLCSHADEKRQYVKDFVKLLQKIYRDNPDFPV